MNDTAALPGDKSVNTDFRPQVKPLPRILVADDEEVLRRLVANSLIESGFAVDAVEDGAVAWEALQAKSYDLLITDNSMPKISGIELIKILRDHDSALPVIMATGAYPAADLERYPQLRITAILLKPYAIEDLLKAVNKTLNEANSFFAPRQLQLFPDTKNFVPPVATHAEGPAETPMTEESLPIL